MTLEPLFLLASYARHRPWCPEASGPGDCTCGLYALLDSIRCACGHRVSVHTDRDVDDVVGWPCSDCKSKRCTGFAIEAAARRELFALDVKRLATAIHAGERDMDPTDRPFCPACLDDANRYATQYATGPKA